MDIGLPGAPGAPVPNAARAAASRRNGAKSRGPKTPEGKARSARNALKHGLRAEKFVLLHDEDAAAFQALTDALADDLAPGPVGERDPNPLPALAPLGALQEVLARRLVVAAWRLERADRIECELFALQAERSERGCGRLGLALVRDGNGRHGRVGERGPNPFPALTPRVRHAVALPRLGDGGAVARVAGAEGAPGGAPGRRRQRGRGVRADSATTGRTTDRTRSRGKPWRNRAGTTCGRRAPALLGRPGPDEPRPVPRCLRPGAESDARMRHHAPLMRH